MEAGISESKAVRAFTSPIGSQLAPSDETSTATAPLPSDQSLEPTNTFARAKRRPDT